MIPYPLDDIGEDEKEGDEGDEGDGEDDDEAVGEDVEDDLAIL